jgi:hypothetical protein
MVVGVLGVALKAIGVTVEVVIIVGGAIVVRWVSVTDH